MHPELSDHFTLIDITNSVGDVAQLLKHSEIRGKHIVEELLKELGERIALSPILPVSNFTNPLLKCGHVCIAIIKFTTIFASSMPLLPLGIIQIAVMIRFWFHRHEICSKVIIWFTSSSSVSALPIIGFS
ncbi:uncharacterized protein EDB93DRAFT_1250776 [Suillus bovinus]|uniref:uncharacterized protein n=1 Tax=Suillus bovinus TaxID=48563 RepID=UPI001B86375D|nr:uncharacterized protein EDB93DRAFT_1250776 [Suillus bovinus]KAG2146494.1 hypothetical protein EDB93DRAFT_1250776 [Suillus bovinus]